MESLSRLSRVLVIAAVAALGVSATGCQPSTSDASPSEKTDTSGSLEAAPIPVETLKVSAVDFTETFEVKATATAVEKVTVSAETGGRILRVGFEEGQEVRAGALLVKVDTKVDSARINLLDNQLESARREYERTHKLADNGLATPQQLEQAETALENARLSLEQAKVGMSKAGVSSPMSGIVSKKFVERGEFASPGAPLATIINYDKIVLEGQVPESRVRYVRVGENVEVHLPALGKTASGTITRRALQTSPRTGTYTVEVTVDNAERDILPGMSAKMTVERKTWEQVPLVPREAILQGFKRSEAMVVDGVDKAGEARMRVVALGPSSGPDVVITSGLGAGDKLIVRGHRGLVNKSRVKSVRHYDSIEQMRSSTGDVDLGQTAKDDESE